MRCPVLISHTPEAELREAIMEMDGPEVDAVVIVGTNLPTARVASVAKFSPSMPVVALNTTTYWHALRQCGIDDSYPARLARKWEGRSRP